MALVLCVCFSDDEDKRSIVTMVDNETIVTTDKGDTFRFTYDYSFWSFDETGQWRRCLFDEALQEKRTLTLTKLYVAFACSYS